jgi:hypothetical protein
MLFVNTKSVRNLLKQKAFFEEPKKARSNVDRAGKSPCPEQPAENMPTANSPRKARRWRQEGTPSPAVEARRAALPCPAGNPASCFPRGRPAKKEALPKKSLHALLRAYDVRENYAFMAFRPSVVSSTSASCSTTA